MPFRESERRTTEKCLRVLKNQDKYLCNPELARYDKPSGSKHYGSGVLLSDIAAMHVQSPRNRGPLESFTNYGVSGVPGDGPYVEIWLVIEKGTIRDAAFRSPGCPSSTAAGSMLCDLARGRSVATIEGLTGTDLLVVLGGLPEGKESYAEMAVGALKNATHQ